MLPSTTERVPLHTAEEINERIRRQTEENIARYAAAGPEAIDRRLEELDREWDIERTLEANAATASLVGLGLGAGVHRGFFLLPAVVAGFLLQHALQGWCPPVPVFRRLGFRTAAEIDHITEFRRESELVLMAETAGFRVESIFSSAPLDYPRSFHFLPRSMAMVLQKKKNEHW